MWDQAQIDEVFARELPPATIDLWSAAGEVDNTTKAAIQSANSNALAGQISGLMSRSIVTIGQSVGFRPEQWAELVDFPAIDGVALAMGIAEGAGLDLGNMAIEVIESTLGKVLGDVGQQTLAVVIDAIPSAVPIARFVVWWAKMIAGGIRQDIAENEAQGSSRPPDTCPLPGYSAQIDRVLADEAIDTLRGGDWTALFRPLAPVTRYWPVCRPQHGSEVFSVVTPGVGLGGQTFDHDSDGPFGFALTPMLPRMLGHRGWIYRNADSISEISDGLPLLGSVGASAWSILWSRGPSAFAVDGEELRLAWQDAIAFEMAVPETTGKDFSAISWWWNVAMSRLWGRSTVTANAPGVLGVAGNPIVKEWSRFAKYQTALLGRVGIAYVDSTTCHPAWRSRVHQAQVDLLTSSKVCDLVLDQIRDLEYRSAVESARAGKVCTPSKVAPPIKKAKLVLNGPSLDPLGSGSRPIPDPPRPPRAQNGGRSKGSGILTLGAGLAGAALAYKLASGGRS